MKSYWNMVLLSLFDDSIVHFYTFDVSFYTNTFVCKYYMCCKHHFITLFTWIVCARSTEWLIYLLKIDLVYTVWLKKKVKYITETGVEQDFPPDSLVWKKNVRTAWRTCCMVYWLVVSAAVTAHMSNVSAPGGEVTSWPVLFGEPVNTKKNNWGIGN